MTTPAPTKADNIGTVITQIAAIQDLFKRGVKTSEFYAGILGVVSTLLVAFLGSDHGLSKHAADLATLGTVVIPIAYGFIRAITKHAQAKVAVAVINANPVNPTPAPAPAPAPVDPIPAPTPPVPPTPSTGPVVTPLATLRARAPRKTPPPKPNA